ncbi:MAG: hypothetical protein IJ274_07130, partial [Lachnospiraceae bacterium]|nr:hypothetical protein [Lachnospiraceae bacterium]
MNNVNYVIGSEMVCSKPLQPYSDVACAFIAALSDALLKDAEAKKYPDIVSLGFWCRKANLSVKKNNWEKRNEKRLGRGLVFHIAPSNVPINFAFSYIFSLLAGNSNIVRLPSKDFPQVSIICRVLKDVMKQYSEIEKRTVFVKYPADNEITEYFSLQADARVIWGGDETVANIRKCQTRPRCIDVVFADRYSICVLSGKMVEETDSAGIKKLAEAFYNDTYLMDQNACSSPQLILWKDVSDKAKQLFWNAVSECAKAKYMLQPMSGVDKYMKLCVDAIELPEIKAERQIGNLVYRVELQELPKEITELRGTCGYFYEYAISGYEELDIVLTEKVQTVTYFGIDPMELQDFVIEHQIRGIDRIVPMGKALDIDVIWDGYD